MEGLVTSERSGTRAAPPLPPGNERRWRMLGWASIAMSVLMVVASLTAYGFYRNVNSKIQRDNVDDQLAADRPEKLNNSLNILLLGSDSREGANRQFGSDSGGGSDTTILMHISPGGERAIGISFPRDSMVQIPECKKKDGTRVPSQFGQLNWAYSLAGPACTWNLIESITDIRIDHYAEIDMAGFIKVVDALGGVEICVPKPVNDPKADLVLKAGRQVVMGKQAVGYVRTRTGGLGDGSDLSRIKRQQAFMGSVVQKATSGLLKDPAKTYAFLEAVAGAVKVDDRLTLGTMQKLANGLRGMSAGKVTFVTVPVVEYPADKNRVQIDTARAKPLFDAIREDNELPPEQPPGKQQAQQAGQQPPAKPSETKVAVYNGTTTDGLGQRTADGLEEQGFQIVKVGTKKQSESTPTQILYGPGAERQAAALAKVLPGHPPKEFPSGKPGVVYLIIGKDGARLQGTGTPLPKIAGERRADQDVCSQTT